MKLEYNAAASRGFANHGWLQANHSFSFANFYNPEKMNFGTLRVLNDDLILLMSDGIWCVQHDKTKITFRFERGRNMMAC